MSDNGEDFSPYLDGADFGAKLVAANDTTMRTLERLAASMSPPIREGLWATTAALYERLADQARQHQRDAFEIL